MITEREEKGIAAFYKEEGLREGFDLGKAEGKAEVARALLKDGMTAEKVMAYTGLSKNEIEALNQ